MCWWHWTSDLLCESTPPWAHSWLGSSWCLPSTCCCWTSEETWLRNFGCNSTAGQICGIPPICSDTPIWRHKRRGSFQSSLQTDFPHRMCWVQTNPARIRILFKWSKHFLSAQINWFISKYHNNCPQTWMGNSTRSTRSSGSPLYQGTDSAWQPGIQGCPAAAKPAEIDTAELGERNPDSYFHEPVTSAKLLFPAK